MAINRNFSGITRLPGGEGKIDTPCPKCGEKKIYCVYGYDSLDEYWFQEWCHNFEGNCNYTNTNRHKKD